MNILFVENQSPWFVDVTKAIEKQGNEVSFISEEMLKKPIDEVALIVYNYSINANIIFINANVILGKIGRNKCSGIKLLKYLRFYGKNQHCVLYSFLSKELLIRLSPENLIIFSKGVSSFRLPYNLSDINIKDLVKKEAVQDLSPYFRAEAKTQENRHFNANWWGVLKLWDVQKAIEGIAGYKKNDDIENDIFRNVLKSKSSYDGLLLQYLHKVNPLDVEKKLKELSLNEQSLDVEKERREEAKNNILNLEQSIAEYSMQIDLLEETCRNLLQGFWDKLFPIAGLFSSGIQQKINNLILLKENNIAKIQENKDYLDLLDKIETKKQEIYELQQEDNRKLQFIINELGKEGVFFSEIETSFDDILAQLKKVCPTIVYVDDSADAGWASIFQRIIYGGESNTFTSYQPKEEETIEQITEKIAKFISEQNPNLLILDLRLRKKEIGNLDPTQISGIQVLRQLQEKEISCPILITTASNKLWSYKNVITLGADAFWTKEGIDANNTLEDTVWNYLDFVNLIYTLCLSDEYILLCEFRKKIKNLKNANAKFWWEEKFWKNDLQYNKTQIPEKTVIVKILQDAYQILHNCLLLKLQSHQNISLQNNMAAIFAIQAFQSVEYIHRWDAKNDAYISDKIKSQLGLIAHNNCGKLLNIRNDAAHNLYVEHKIDVFIDKLFEYLQKLPSKLGSTTLGKIDSSTFSESYLRKQDNSKKKEDIQKSKIYISNVIKQDPYKRNLFYIENPNLNLEGGRHFILLDSNRNMLNQKDISIGTKIQFSIIVSEYDLRKNYFAENAKIIE